MADSLRRCLSVPNRVHFIGIGGVGMAGLARLLYQAGFSVSGSDNQPNRLTRELAEQGVNIYQGHHPDHVRELPDWAIRTPALGEGNPEVDYLRAQHVPVMVRGQVLAAYSRKMRCIAIAGAHGKTTTTSMLATIFDYLGTKAGYAVGGETNLPGAVADAGKGDLFVLEADESDGTLVYYAPEVGVLTHVEWDHVERFRSEKALLNCYRTFVNRCGELWIREDDSLAEKVCEGHAGIRRIGESERADLQLLSARQSSKGQTIQFRFLSKVYGLVIPLPGKHNAWNALMAIASAGCFGVSIADACKALESFSGVARRFQRVEKHGIDLIQDYAHHPTEIRAVMKSAEALNLKRLWVVFQPHRFSRTQHLLSEFAASFDGADRLALLPVYAASELSSQGVGSELLAEACRKNFPGVKVFPSRADLISEWAPQLESGDVVLIVGAGDIEALQAEFLVEL